MFVLNVLDPKLGVTDSVPDPDTDPNSKIPDPETRGALFYLKMYTGTPSGAEYCIERLEGQPRGAVKNNNDATAGLEGQADRQKSTRN